MTISLRLTARSATVLFLTITQAASAGQLLTHSNFEAAAALPALSGWQIDPQVGGTFKHAISDGIGTVTLTGTRFVDSRGDQHYGGRLMQSQRVEITPDRRYVLRVEARGDGELCLGAVEFPDQYSPVRLSARSQSFPLTPEWQTFTYTFKPADAAMFVSVFFQTEGWLGHADLRNPSLNEEIEPGKISLTAGDFVFAQGEPILLHMTSDHTPVKLFLYGPGGVLAGPGGKYGGSDAWGDHFLSSFSREVKPGISTPVTINVPASARDGFYRVLAVDSVTGQCSESGFCLYSPSLTSELRSLASRIDLPRGSKLIFVGDSLTDLYRGRNYVDLVSRAISKKYGDQVQVINAGVGGDTIKQIEKRLTDDVIGNQPTHVFLYEGGNDSKRRYNAEKGLADEWHVPRETYAQTYRNVIHRIREETSAQVVVMTMAPGDQRILGPIRERAITFGEARNFFCLPEDTARMVALQKKIAGEFQVPVIDTNARLQEFIDNPKNAEFLHVDDGIHPSEAGNREVALSVLRHLAVPRQPGKSLSAP